MNTYIAVINSRDSNDSNLIIGYNTSSNIFMQRNNCVQSIVGDTFLSTVQILKYQGQYQFSIVYNAFKNRYKNNTHSRTHTLLEMRNFHKMK